MTRTIEEIKKAILNYFEENEDDFNEVIEDLDSYNGYLGDDRYFEMWELDEFYRGEEPSEILARAFYGYDGDYTDENGNHTEPFNPNKPYYTYNGYGNLVSAYYKDYTAHLDNWFVNNLIENYMHLCTLPNEIEELIEELEDLDEE